VDPGALRDDVVTIGVQVDGKLRDRIRVPGGAGERDVLEAAMSSEQVRRHLSSGTPRVRAYVPDRLLSLVT
jgi:leucyl-tRNA synthetase